jgi:hypothetical protein
MATRGPKPKNTKIAITPELIVMAGSAPNFYHRYI